MILGYVVRHGSTDMSPQPEWQLPIPLNALGRAEATVAGEWLKKKAKPLPDWGIASDLPRAMETLGICTDILGIETRRPLAQLRAIDFGEDPHKFEARNKQAFTAIFATRKVSKKIPLIACHRSNTAYLAKFYGGVTQEIDYRETSVVVEGGLIEISTENGLMPLFGALDENPRANLSPADGTMISGFVTAEANHLPRKCGHCKWMDTDHCDNLVVTADDEVGLMFGRKRNASGKWKVEDKDCCNHYQHIFVLPGGQPKVQKEQGSE